MVIHHHSRMSQTHKGRWVAAGKTSGRLSGWEGAGSIRPVGWSPLLTCSTHERTNEMQPEPTSQDGALQEILEQNLPDPDIYQIELKDRLKMLALRAAPSQGILPAAMAWAQGIRANGLDYCKARRDDLVADLWDNYAAEIGWRKIWAKHKISFNSYLKSPTYHLIREKAARAAVYRAMGASQKAAREHGNVWLELFDKALALEIVIREDASVTRV